MKPVVRILGAAVLLCICTLITSVAQMSWASADETPQNQVKIDNFAFTPPTITVSTGTEVKWVNHDDIPHTVVSDDKSFKSKALDTDQEFTFTFSKPGTYTYFCSIHPKMTGKVVVK